MIKTTIVLDGSAVMGLPSQDLPPFPALGLRKFIPKYISDCLSGSPLSLVSAVVMRDGIAHIVCPFTNNKKLLLEQLETRYFLFPPVGTMSLQNGLQATLNLMYPSGFNESNSSIAQQRISLISGSVSVVDPGDVHSIIDVLKERKIKCDVISFTGAPQIFTTLTIVTGGRFFCPISGGGKHLIDILSNISQIHSNSSENSMHGIGIGFPTTFKYNKKYNSTNLKCENVYCPRCFHEVYVPSVCSHCGLLNTSLTLIHISYLNGRFPKEISGSLVKDQLDRISPLRIKCGCCGTLSSCTDKFFCCKNCNIYRCRVCEDYVRNTLKMCPGCVV